MTPGQLRFDSARAAPGRSRANRALLFEAGDLAVDVMVRDGDGERRILLGQVVRGASGAAVAGAAVRIEDKQVRTDAHGQFAVTLPRHTGLATDLTIDAPEGDTIVVAIPDGEAESS